MDLKVVVLSCLLTLAHAGLLPIVESFEKLTEIRIVGGHDAQVGQFPYMVSVQCIFSGKNLYFCGGSIINSRWILTAANCIKSYYKYCPENTLYIRAGKHNIVVVSEPYEQLVQVSEYIIHNKYSFGKEVSEHDLALLKLKSPLKLNTYVRAISLPRPNTEPKYQAKVCGWGHDNFEETTSPRILQTVDVTIIDKHECNHSISIIDPLSTPYLYKTNICTGPLSGGVSICKGDPGGPLVINVHGEDTLVGVVSWGFKGCGIKHAPSIYVKVSDYVYWINHIMSITH